MPKFIKVVPTDYKDILEKIEQHKLNGLSDENAEMQAFVETTESQKKLVSLKCEYSSDGKSDRFDDILSVLPKI